MNQTALFDIPAADPEPRQKCTHPAEAQILTGNLFTLNSDLTCADCGATIAPDYQC